ncbi:hypothetical protein ACHAWU_009506 [Discostella pseudostelligera]|uniref:Reverse transcriptase domain-containing protein n=1 Tax=Discostella pseudostelligera TaxID=259834 RepID=A0ABD3MJ30_9STRA
MAEDACFDKILTLDLSRQERRPMALVSVDAAQCYDRVNHIMMSLVWTALGVSQTAISIIVDCLSNMTIYTRTGFGDLTSSFGGRDQLIPFCGLGQGSKAAPASWIQLSSIIINSFRSRGLGACFRDPITQDDFSSIGCVYVDDTDLYVAGPSLNTVREVIAMAQVAIPVWSLSIGATGGLIKGDKSGWYLICYSCHNGVWKEERIWLDLLIPLTDTEDIILQQYELTDAVKSLGIKTSPVGGHAEQLLAYHDKVQQWAAQMRNGHLPAALVWMSYLQQLWPSLRYGLGALTNDWSSASTCMDDTDIKLLSMLGVNRHIAKPWRRLHQTFGGIGLLDLATEQHICRINFFLQHYGSLSTLGKKLMSSLHFLQLQLGCSGCPILQDYVSFGHLATLSWVKMFWESLHHCPGTVEIDYSGIPLQREGDITIMDMAKLSSLDKDGLTSVNRCRCYGHIMFLSDISTAAGDSIDDDFLSGPFTPLQSSFTFPPEEPTSSDWKIWNSFLHNWPSLATQHGISLGSWQHIPHSPWRWFFDSEHQTVYERAHGKFMILKRAPGRTRLESGYCYTGHSTEEPLGLPASVHLIQTGCGLLYFDDGTPDVTWLAESFQAGNLIGVADGSNDRVCSPHISGTGWILCDKLTRRTLAGNFTEVSSSGSSYRGEVLGLCAMHVLVLTIKTHFACSSSSGMTIFCDNEVAVDRANQTVRRIKPRWACGDVLRSFRNIRPKISTSMSFEYVESHMDDHIPWESMSLPQQLNCQCDYLAKQAVKKDRLANPRVYPNEHKLPCELATVCIDGNKITRDPSDHIRTAVGRLAAKQFLTGDKGWSIQQFEAVAWDHLHATLRTKSNAFRIWLSKQHSNFCATGVQMVRCGMSDDDRCPSCWKRRERAEHLCKCPSAAWSALLEKSVSDLQAWMSTDERTDPELAYWVGKYIRGRGGINFSDLGSMSPRMMTLAESQDLIGWRNFMEGQISSRFYSIQLAHLAPGVVRMNASDWMRGFITRVLQMTHAQWLLRNFMLHDYRSGFLQLKRRVDILYRIEELSHTQDHEIPAESRFLLEIDTNQLALGDLDGQEYWVCAMEAAKAALRLPSCPTRSPSTLRRPSLWKGGVFSLREEIRREWGSDGGPLPDWWHTGLAGEVLSVAPRPSVAHIAARVSSNRRRKPD